MTDALSLLDATAQAELVHRGEASPRELVEAAITRVERLNPRLNAVVATTFDEALAAAAGPLPDGPFRGVPLLVKDLAHGQAGVPESYANRVLKAMGRTAPRDIGIGPRFRAAGFITIGVTNAPELGSSPTCQSIAHGPCHNPWDPTRSPAGSSGGAAAATAAGIVPLAHANDGGGSTRLPASWNGLVGLKTSRGRVTDPGNMSRLTSQFAVCHSVRDAAALLDAVHGHAAGDLFAAPAPARTYRAEVVADPGRLRIGVLTSAGDWEIHHEAVAAATGAARLLEDLGHHVEMASDSVLFGAAARVNGALWMAAIARSVDRLGEMAGRSLTADEVEGYNWTAAERGRSMSAAEWVAGQERQQAWVLDAVAWLERYDVLVTPTSGVPPLTTEELQPQPAAPWRIGRTYGRIGVFTLPFNATGNPAVSLPLHRTAAGLPLGVQLVGGMYREDILLRVASQLEAAAPWRAHLPAVHASR